MVNCKANPRACALVVRITTAPRRAGEALPDDLTRSELERHVLTELISRDVQLVEADAWAALAARMKEGPGGRPSAEIVDELVFPPTPRRRTHADPLGQATGFQELC